MNYELAKKLEEAGYPQETVKLARFEKGLAVKPVFWIDENEGLHLHGFGEPPWKLGLKAVYLPSLEELIEACKSEKRFVLWFDGEQWHAGLYDYGDSIYIDSYPSPNKEGQIPIEAVVNLWIALNKK